MSSDVDARLRADGEHWRGVECSVAPVPLETALAALAELHAHDEATAVFELTGGPPPRHRSAHVRWVWAAVAAAVVVLTGASAAVIGTTRHAAGPNAAAALRGTSWVAPGAGTNGVGTTLTFDPAAKKLTINDRCDTSAYHVTVGRGTLRIGRPDGIAIVCSPAARLPGPYPTAGDPSVNAEKAVDAVLRGTVTWTIDNRTLILGRGARKVTLFATATIAQRCAATEVTVTAAGATHRYPFGGKPPTLTANAPVDIDAAASGPCRAAVAITLAPASKPSAWISHNRYGYWRVTQPGVYQLTFTLQVCTPANGDCSLGLNPLPITIHLTP